MNARALAGAALLLLGACDASTSSDAPLRAGNVLLVVADDVGQDALAAYRQRPDAPPTPAIDALAARGVLFENAYANPWCSPTRATILTGRYGFRTGVGIPLSTARDAGLPLDELTLPALLHEHGVHSALIGKWHLGGDPRERGFEHFAGTIANLASPAGYFDHFKQQDGRLERSTTYATTEQVDDALRAIRSLGEPWFVELSFNAAHQPFHAPPAELHGYRLQGEPDLEPRAHYDAAVEALDRELGRLLASLAPELLERTTVIFVGDNGSPNEVVEAPIVRGRSKGTLFESGIRVPLVIAGRGVAARGQRCARLVNTVDLFPTIAELLGVERDELPRDRTLDGVSLGAFLADASHAPLRAWVYADKFWPNGPGPYDSVHRVLRDERWKLMLSPLDVERFFDLRGAQIEGPNLLAGTLTDEQREAYERLKSELARLTGG